MAEIVIRLWVDENVLWDNVTQTGAWDYPWWFNFTDRADRTLEITIQDPEYPNELDKRINKTLSVGDVVRGYEKYLQVNDTKVDEIDGAAADEILQFAIFGETAFG